MNHQGFILNQVLSDGTGDTKNTIKITTINQSLIIPALDQLHAVYITNADLIESITCSINGTIIQTNYTELLEDSIINNIISLPLYLNPFPIFKEMNLDYLYIINCKNKNHNGEFACYVTLDMICLKDRKEKMNFLLSDSYYDVNVNYYVKTCLENNLYKPIFIEGDTVRKCTDMIITGSATDVKSLTNVKLIHQDTVIYDTDAIFKNRINKDKSTQWTVNFSNPICKKANIIIKTDPPNISFNFYLKYSGLFVLGFRKNTFKILMGSIK